MRDTLAAPNPMPALTAEAAKNLEQSIRLFGVLTPVIVSAGPAYPGALVDGFNRRRIAQKVGQQCPEVRVAFQSEAEFRIAQIALNVERRHLTPVERVELGLTIEPLITELKAQQHRGERNDRLLSEVGFLSKLTGEPITFSGRTQDAFRTRSIVGEIVGLGGKQYDRIKQVLRDGEPELVEALRSGRVNAEKAVTKLRTHKPIGNAAIIKLATKQSLGVPSDLHGTYAGVVVNPPWSGAKRIKTHPYALFPAQVEQLPIAEFAARDAVIYLWAPFLWLEDAFRIVRLWHAEPAALLTWEARGAATIAGGFQDADRYCVVGVLGQPRLHPIAKETLAGPGPGLPSTFYRQVDVTLEGRKAVLFDAAPSEAWAGWNPLAVQTDLECTLSQ